MSDEGKPIEEIIAELETLEMKRAEEENAKEPGASDVEAEISVENSQQLSDTTYRDSEELTVEETPSEAEGDIPSAAVEPSDDEYEDIFGEHGKEEHHGIEPPDELVLESYPEEGISPDTAEGDAFEGSGAGISENETSPEPPVTEPLEELILEDPIDELILDDVGDGETLTLEAVPDDVVSEEVVIGETEERPIEEKIFDDIFADRMNGSHVEDATASDVSRRLSMEALAKEFADLELTPETPSEDMTAEISLDSDVEGVFEEPARSVETDADTAGPAFESTDDSWSPDPPRETVAAGGITNTDPGGDESDDESEEPPSPPPEKKAGRRIGLLFVLFLVVVAGYAYLVWPTMYRQGQMISGDRAYSTRIHRITQVEEYYEGGVWHRGPGPKVIADGTPAGKVLPNPIVTARKNPVAKAEKQAETKIQPAEQAPVKAVLHKIEKQEQEVAGEEEMPASPEVAKDEGVVPSVEREVPGDDVQPAKAVTLPEGDGEKNVAVAQVEKVVVEAPRDITVSKKAKAAAPVEPVKQERADTREVKADPAPNPVAPVSRKKDKTYAIQIGSMRFLEFASDIVEELDKKEMDPHMQIVETARNGVWYVVYIGHFEGKQNALKYMKDNKIEKRYPGCYVRKVSLVTAQK